MRRWRISFIVRRASIRRMCIEYGSKNTTSVSISCGRHAETVNVDEHLPHNWKVWEMFYDNVLNMWALAISNRKRGDFRDWRSKQLLIIAYWLVLNSSYIEPRQFLDDAKDIVLDRIHDNLQRHIYLKVNTIFNGELVADAKRSAKSITTKNNELLDSFSNLRECTINTWQMIF